MKRSKPDQAMAKNMTVFSGRYKRTMHQSAFGYAASIISHLSAEYTECIEDADPDEFKKLYHINYIFSAPTTPREEKSLALIKAIARHIDVKSDLSVSADGTKINLTFSEEFKTPPIYQMQHAIAKLQASLEGSFINFQTGCDDTDEDGKDYVFNPYARTTNKVVSLNEAFPNLAIDQLLKALTKHQTGIDYYYFIPPQSTKGNNIGLPCGIVPEHDFDIYVATWQKENPEEPPLAKSLYFDHAIFNQAAFIRIANTAGLFHSPNPYRQ